MDINYELDKYKSFYKMYKEVIRGLTDDYDYDIAIDNTDYDDSNSKVTLKIYKSDYNYANRDELIRLYNNGELFIYSNSVILNNYLAFNLVNLIRDNFILGHDILLPFFARTCVAFPVKLVYTTSSSGSIPGNASIRCLTRVDFPVPAYPLIIVYFSPCKNLSNAISKPSFCF